MVTLSATAQLETTSSLWSNNTSFIELAQNYFENKWNNTTNEEPQLKTIANHQTNSQPTKRQNIEPKAADTIKISFFNN